ACDRDKDGRLSESEMLCFAQATGFQGTAATWSQEYRLLCFEWAAEQVDFKVFRALVDTEADYCSNQ
ncbi:unnamed protein product, partial [Polarella glacialis]